MGREELVKAPLFLILSIGLIGPISPISPISPIRPIAKPRKAKKRGASRQLFFLKPLS